MKMGLIFRNDFYRIIEEAFEYIGSQRSTINGKSGWHQFLESGKIGNIASAQIIFLYQQFGRQITDIDSCLKWFRANKRKIVWKERSISGWSYLSSGPAFPCIEPTCWVCLAYQALAIQETKSVELETHNFIDSTKILSQHGLSWGFTPWCDSSISPTCVAIIVLNRACCEIHRKKCLKLSKIILVKWHNLL